MSNPESDTIVYNATVSNTTIGAKKLEFTQFHRRNILDKAEDYYVRVFEAKIPIMSVPLFRHRPNTMSVTINHSTVDLVPIQLNPINGDVVYIFYIQQFLDSLNNALAAAHNLNGYTDSAPIMVYDYENELLSLIVDVGYYGNGADPVPIYFSPKLMYKFTGFMNLFDSQATPGYEYRLLYDSYYASHTRPAGIIPYDAIYMTSQSKFYKDFLEYQSLILTSATLRINEQYITNGIRDPISGLSETSLAILAEIPLSFEELNSSKYLTFFQGFPKWTTINASGPVKNIDFACFFVGDDFEINPLFILPGQKFNIRLEFINKSLVRNYPPPQLPVVK